MSKKTRRQTQTIIALSAISVWIAPGTARGEEPFLWLPFSAGHQVCPPCERTCGIPDANRVCIYCRWTCLNEDGTTYRHHATDYGHTGTGKEIRTAAGGEVIFVDDVVPENSHPRGRPYGNRVEIRHTNRYVTIYAHFLPGIRVAEGARVTAGQLLGLSDNTGQSTGPHLHFEVRDPQGRRVNPYGDPPDYSGGCGPNALWVTCPPTPAPPPDADGDGFTTAAGDCNDTNRDVHPGAVETCNNRDDDCSGTPDDPWRVDFAQDIGNPCTVGIGACANIGTWMCAPNGVTTVCSVDPIPPQSESCNGLDDDCDEAIDEDWRIGLAQDIGNPCEISWDACRGSTSGTWVCAPGGLSTVCDAPTPPGTPATAEVCNGIDDDCNREVDDLAVVVLSSGPAYRHYPSVAWDATNDQFGVVWVERIADAYHLFFQLLNGAGDSIGSPREIDATDRFRSYGTDITWDGSGYGIAWLATRPGGGDWNYELVFLRVDADGVIVQPARSVAAGPWNYSGSTSYIRSRVRIAAWDDQYTVGVMALLPNSLTLYRLSVAGDLIGEPSESISTTELSDIFALAGADGSDIVAWNQNTGSGHDFSVGVWDGVSVRRTAIESNYYGWRFGTSASCVGATSCRIRSLVSLLGSRGIRAHDVDTTTMAVTEIVGMSYGRDAMEAAMNCHDSICTIASSAFSGGVPQRSIDVVVFREDERMLVPQRTISYADGHSAFAVARGATISVVAWSMAAESPWIAEPSQALIATKFCP